jgi:hypothetical protein
VIRAMVFASVLALTSAATVFAQVTPTTRSEWDKGWIDVNFGVAVAAEKEYSSDFVFTRSLENGVGLALYTLPTGASFDFGGGYMFTRYVGVGISFGGTAHEDTVGLGLTVPHPNFFNEPGIGVNVTDKPLMRVEGARHIQLMAVPWQTQRLRLRVFGGPSHFRAEQEVITNIRYIQTTLGRANLINITSYDSEKSLGTGWGAHVGADFSVFSTRVVGVGGGVRISRGTVQFEDYGGFDDRKVGGVQAGGGLRLKF